MGDILSSRPVDPHSYLGVANIPAYDAADIIIISKLEQSKRRGRAGKTKMVRSKPGLINCFRLAGVVKILETFAIFTCLMLHRIGAVGQQVRIRKFPYWLTK